jgi:hypothetical protein
VIARQWLNNNQTSEHLVRLANLDTAVRAEPRLPSVARFRRLIADIFGNDLPIDETLRQARQFAGDLLCAAAVIPGLREWPELAHRLLLLASAAQHIMADELDNQAIQALIRSIAVLPPDLFSNGTARIDRDTTASEEPPRIADNLPVLPEGEADMPDDATTFEPRRAAALAELTHRLQFGPEAERVILPAVPDGEFPDESARRLRAAGELAVLSTRLRLTDEVRSTLSRTTNQIIEAVAPGHDDLLDVINILERAPAHGRAVAQAMALTSPTAGFPPGYGATRPPVQGLVRPPGIGDLLVVRHSHKSYELGAIAHIENVLAGEARERVHRRLDRTEELQLSETERIEIDERDLQTTERFELVTETSNEVNSQTELEIGLQVSASYGPVRADASFGYTSSTARADASRQATTSSRETVNRAVKRTTERTRELRQRLTIREIEETNRHRIENTTDTNLSGIYRWIDHVETVGVYNYGTRLMIEVHVPEPGAWLRWATTVISSPPPPPPTLPDGSPLNNPGQLTPTNYLAIAGRQGASVQPPPELYTTVGLNLTQEYQQNTPGSTTPAFLFYKSDKTLKVKDNYKGVRVMGVLYASAWKFDVNIAIGATHFNDPSPGGAMPLTLNIPLVPAVDGDVPIAFVINNAWGYTLALELICQRTDRALELWQLSTFTAIWQAYDQRRSAWEEAQSVAAISAGVGIRGRNPETNRHIERAELKKGAISLLAGSPLDSFGAVTPGTASEPTIDALAAVGQGQIISFYEQAFEWEQLTYTLYPYFWGRHDVWQDGFGGENDPDPRHDAFLRAGVARVVVPVRPAFEWVALHFLATGKLWLGGKAPPIGDPLYVSIANELIAAETADRGGALVGSTWEERTPTTLVYLQADAVLNPPEP